MLEKPIFATLGDMKYEDMIERRGEMVGMAGADGQSGGEAGKTLNQTIEMSLGREDLLTSALGGTLTMRIEFDNCRENEGPVTGGDRLEFELNAFGKPPMLKSSDLKRVKINNTKFDSQVIFKLCIGGSPNGGDKRN